ncbi:MAG: hypothetical protein Q9209_001677 [Squamulea sp. 1 TL-2023]
MADPASVFSIASGAAALALGCGTIAKRLYDLAQRYRDTESLLSSIAQELSTTQCAWRLIHNLMDDWKSQGHISHEVLQRLDQSVAWGNLILTALENEIFSCTRRLAVTGEGSFRHRFCRSRVVWSEKSLKRHQERIRGQTMSMGLLISVLKIIFDDMLYHQLSNDNELYTSNVYKWNYRSRSHMSSSPSQVSPPRVQTGRACTNPAETIAKERELSNISITLHDAPMESESSRPHADAHADIIHGSQVGSRLSAAVADKLLDAKPGTVRNQETHNKHELESALLDACRYGDIQLAEELLCAGVSVHCRMKEADGHVDGSTPIHLAAIYSQPQIAMKLLHYDAFVDDHHRGGRRPLHEAAEARDETVTRILLEHGSKPGLRDGRGLEPLHLACQHGSTKVAALLIDAGSAVDSADNNRYRPMHHLAQECDDPYLARLLVDMGCEIGATTNQGYTALQLACISGNAGVLAVLLCHGASLGSSRWSASPLNLAIRGGHLNVIQILLRNGVDVNAIDPFSHTTISHLVIRAGSSAKKIKKMLALLLEHGMDINAQDAEGNTSLHIVMTELCAVKTNAWQLMVVKALLVHGAKTGISNHRGDFPLTLAYRLALVAPVRDVRLYRLLIAASIHHFPDKQLARIERDMRCTETSAHRTRSKEMVALLGAARVTNMLDLGD